MVCELVTEDGAIGLVPCSNTGPGDHSAPLNGDRRNIYKYLMVYMQRHLSSDSPIDPYLLQSGIVLCIYALQT